MSPWEDSPGGGGIHILIPKFSVLFLSGGISNIGRDCQFLVPNEFRRFLSQDHLIIQQNQPVFLFSAAWQWDDRQLDPDRFE